LIDVEPVKFEPDSNPLNLNI